MERVNLEAQCKEFELEINTDPTEWPERTAFERFAGQRYKGAFCEGGAILTVLKGACLDTLTVLGARHNTMAIALSDWPWASPRLSRASTLMCVYHCFRMPTP